MSGAAEPETVFEMGQKVATYDAHDHYICDGVIEGIHHPAEPDGEEIYDVRTELYGVERLSEMRLTDA